MSRFARNDAALVLAIALGLVMLGTVVSNAITLWRCTSVLDVYVRQQDSQPIEEVPVFCDTTAEAALVLDIGLALAGGLVGYLAGTSRKEE